MRSFKRWAAAAALLTLSGAGHADIVTGDWRASVTFGSGGPVNSNAATVRMVFDDVNESATFTLTEFELDGIDQLAAVTNFSMDDLGGNGRFRARLFRFPGLAGEPTLEVFYRFAFDFSNWAPIVGSPAAILSNTQASGNVNATGRSSFTEISRVPSVVTPPPGTVPTPGTLALAGLALAGAAFVSRARRARAAA